MELERIISLAKNEAQMATIRRMNRGDRNLKRLAVYKQGFVLGFLVGYVISRLESNA